MLRLIYYEIRKNYLRGYVLAAILLFICLNVCIIYRNYMTGDGLLGYFMSHSKETQMQWDFYYSMHEKLDGPLTTDHARFVIDEYNRLNSLVADGTYSREYQQDSYTGYIWGDYAMITKYFYQPMKFAAGYEANLNQVVEKARDNIVFYKKYNNNYEMTKNEYIQNHYSGRQISVFYDGKPWELLFKYRFSDLLILLLMLLGLVPIYAHEKEANMDGLILSCRKGQRNMALAKVLSLFFFIAFLLIVFSITNIVTFGLLYRLSGWGMPLYAVEAFQFTPIDVSVLAFYVLLVLFKLGGFAVIGLCLSLLSALFQRVLYPYLLGVLLMVGGSYASGFLASEEAGKTLWALGSPFTLLKGNELFSELLGMNLGNTFFTRSSILIVVQFIIGIVLYVLIRRFSTTRSMKRSGTNPIKVGA